MRRIRLSVYIVSIIIFLLSPDIKALEIDTVQVYWKIQDCITSIPLDSVTIYFIIWDPKAGQDIPGACTIALSPGIFCQGFDISDLQRKVRYYIRRPDYIQVNGEFNLNTGLEIEVCLWPIGYTPTKENVPSTKLITGIVKSDKGKPITAAIIRATIGDSSDSLPQEFSNSVGEFKWSFHPSVFGKNLQWNISKDGYLDSKGNFLIEKDQSLYVTLAPKKSSVSIAPEKKRDVLKDYIIPLGAFGAWAAALIATAF